MNGERWKGSSYPRRDSGRPCSMAQRNHVPDGVPEALHGLVRQLAELPAGARETVVEAARRAANEPKGKLPTLSWASLRAARGIVRLGGNALEDSRSSLR